jgi:hypothetical protein
MKTKLHRSPISLAALCAAMFSLVACGGYVVKSGSGEGGSGGAASGGTGGGSAGGSAGGSNAIAMLYSQFPDVSGGGGGTSGTTGPGGGPDPNTLYVMIGNDPIQCTNPYQSQACDSTVHWQVSIGIPPSLQKVGTIPLSSPELISTASDTGPNQGASDCWGGGGSFIEGTLEITAIDTTHVEGVLSGTQQFEFNADGPFNAQRCVF